MKNIQTQLLLAVFCLVILSGCDPSQNDPTEETNVATYNDATFNNSTWE